MLFYVFSAGIPIVIPFSSGVPSLGEFKAGSLSGGRGDVKQARKGSGLPEMMIRLKSPRTSRSGSVGDFPVGESD